MSGQYSEFRYWSPLDGQTMARLSMFNGRGHEFHMTIPAGHGKDYRDRRETALDAIATAIDLGCDPGEVRTR